MLSNICVFNLNNKIYVYLFSNLYKFHPQSMWVHL